MVAEFRRVGLLPRRTGTEKRITFLKIDVEFMELDVVGGKIIRKMGIVHGAGCGRGEREDHSKDDRSWSWMW